MNNEKEIQKKVLEFHGHSCPGVAIGIRAAEIATDKLFSSRDVDEELLAIVENDSCSVDAIQFLLLMLLVVAIFFQTLW